MGLEDDNPILASEVSESRIPYFEHDEEYVQDMSHEDLQRLALKLKGYDEAAERPAQKT